MIKKILVGGALLTVCSVSYAQVWAEVGNAPELLPGQQTVGAGALTTITGTIDTANADLFAINITNFAAFSASTNNGLGSLGDTQLFLLDSAGMGVTHDDDDPIGGTLRSKITSVFLTGNGLYYLGISNWDRDPTSLGSEIWLDTPFNAERAPDGPGAGGAMDAWSGASTGIGTYQIDLTGAEFAAVPEPASMIALGLGAAALIRRRRNKKA